MNRLKIFVLRMALTCGMLGCTASTVKADGLSGEYLLLDEWRRLLAFYSPLSNPAFMTEQDYTSFRGAAALALDGPARLFELGVVVPLGLYQSAGFSVASESGKDIEGGGGYVDAAGNYNTVTSRVHNSNNTFILSYAVNLWSRLSIGANFNMAHHTNFSEDPSLSMCFDLGASLRLLRNPVLGDHVFGVTYQNFLSNAVSLGSGEPFSEQIRTILHSQYAENRLESTIEFDITDIAADASNFVDGDAAIEWGMTTQLGAWMLRLIKLDAFLGFQGDADGGRLASWGFAGGINAPMVNNGRDFLVEYQFRDETNSQLMATHSVYLRADVGMHREEIYARKMARLASLMPNELYNKALRLYSAGKYWDAFFVFGQILALFPDFFKNDMVTYYRGSCLEEMDMRGKSLSTYENVKADYPRSSAMAMADLGIMRIAYREDDRLKVERQFNCLNGDEVADSIKFHAYYIMGELCMRSGDTKRAEKLFGIIPETHPEYMFAQHSIGICAVISLDMEAAASAFVNCLQAQIKTDAMKETYNRSCLMLGYLFYEQSSLSKAVTALRMVPASSYYYEDALLGLGWCALKAHQWDDCINTGSLLVQTSTKQVLKYEGILVKSYGYMMQKNYTAASAELELIFAPLAELKPPSQNSLEGAGMANTQLRIEYEELASKAEELSIVEASALTMKMIDSMHVPQTGTYDRLVKYEKYVDEFQRSGLFLRNIEKIREDVDYAMAVVEKLSRQEGSTKVMEKLKEKSGDIDSEIQKIEQEMKNIDSE